MSLRKNKVSSMSSASYISNATSISLKIQKQMERIIIIIKDMENLSSVDELKQLNRLLYRATDNLMEFELSLHQLKVYTPPPLNKILVCAACGKPWPHNHDIPDAYY